ncbi:MHO_4530 family protein [Mycoplasmopsis hyopharyngis]|uniref:MHO_4530 family protein n=1 Tax=Mycoplasmopsis hyopharyngis TaxID=29558 RepID=UPI003872F538
MNWEVFLKLFVAITFSILLFGVIFWISYVVRKKHIDRNNSGLVTFHIDWKNKKIVKETENYLSKNLPWDQGKNLFKHNVYRHVDDFLKTIAEEYRKRIIEYFENPNNDRFNISFKFDKSIEWKKINKKNNENFDVSNCAFLLKVYKNKDDTFYCTIHYHYNKSENRKYDINKLQKPLDIKNLSSKYFLAYCINFKPDMSVKKDFEINDIFMDVYALLGIDYKKTFTLLTDNIMFIIYGFNSYFSLKYKAKNLLTKMRQNIKKLPLNYNVESFSLLEWNKALNEKDIQLIISKAKFLLFNNMQNLNNNKYYYWGLDDYSLQNEFNEFTLNIDNFEKRNDIQDYVLEYIPINIIEDNTQSNTKLKLLDLHINGISKNTFDFFKKISFYKYKYESNWVKYLIQNSKKDEVALIKINDLKIDFLRSNSKKNLYFLVNYPDENYNFNNIFDMTNELLKIKNGLGLYVNNITNELINFVKSVEVINLIVISSNIVKNLQTNSSTYLKLLNLKKSLPEESKIIYEMSNNKIDEYIAKKLEIKYVINI